jgi:hypothetical protein
MMKKRNYNQNQRALNIIEKFNVPMITRYRFASYICGVGQEKYPGLRRQLFLRILKASCNKTACYKKDLLNYDSKIYENKITISKKTLRQIIAKINREAKTDVIRYYDGKKQGWKTPARSYYISFFDYSFMGEPQIEKIRNKYNEIEWEVVTNRLLEIMNEQALKFSNGDPTKPQTYFEFIERITNFSIYLNKSSNAKTNTTSEIEAKYNSSHNLADACHLFSGGILDLIYGERAEKLYYKGLDQLFSE